MTLSICGILKEVLTISAASVVFHDEISTVNGIGLVVTVATIAAYNYFKMASMRDEASREGRAPRSSCGPRGPAARWRAPRRTICPWRARMMPRRDGLSRWKSGPEGRV